MHIHIHIHIQIHIHTHTYIYIYVYTDPIENWSCFHLNCIRNFMGISCQPSCSCGWEQQPIHRRGKGLCSGASLSGKQVEILKTTCGSQGQGSISGSGNSRLQ